MAKTYHSSIVNIDSSYRDIYPKHIFNSNFIVLPKNPLTFTINSNILKIHAPNHKLSINDNIIIKNITGETNILNNSFYLINNINYLVIKKKNNLDITYKKYISDLFINIELLDNNINNYINNIPVNSFLGIKKYYLYNEINIDKYKFTKLTEELFNISALDENNNNFINNNFIFIDMNIIYVNTIQEYQLIDNIFKLSLLHINGIKLGYLNADYPINNINYQNKHSITSIIDSDNFEIELSINSSASNIIGGNNITINKIYNTIEGYPNPDNYTINLKKTFNNVVAIRLLSMELPYITDLIIKNQNDKLYWKILEDGDYVYHIQLNEGVYDKQLLLNSIKTKMNETKKITYSDINKEYNIFDISFDISLNTITFKSFKNVKLPNSLSLKISNINNNSYLILTVVHKNNILVKDDEITISGSDNLTFYDNSNQLKYIDASYINTKHNIYSINITNNTYDIMLGNLNTIKYEQSIIESKGGENIIFNIKSKFSLLFNKSDTIGDILGFKYVGSDFSITDYKYEISNSDNYLNSINLDYTGNILKYTNGIINLQNKYNYILMYLNDIEYVYNNNKLDSCFSKILLPNNYNNILFNTFVEMPFNSFSKSFPIETLSELNIKFIYPDGSNVNFKNLNHSFTLQIIEEKLI